MLRTLAITLMAVGLMLTQAGCKKKKTEGSPGGGTAAAEEATEKGEGREGAEATEAREGAEGKDTQKGLEVKDPHQGGTAEFPDLDKLLDKQKGMGKLMEGITSLEDLEKRKGQFTALSEEILEMTLESMREALKMPKDKLKAYLTRSMQMNKANAEFAIKLRTMQMEIMKIEGAKELLERMQKETAARLKDKTDELMRLMKEVAKRQAELSQE